MRRAATWLLAAAIAAVAGLSAVDTVRDANREAAPAHPDATRRPDRLRGPDVPQGGVLAGRLVLAEAATCRLRVLDLAKLELGAPGPGDACRIWPSPRGDVALVARRARGSGAARELWLARLDDPPALVRRLGLALSRPSWSTDGRLVAWCEDDRATTVLDVASRRAERIPGCYPTIRPGGRVVTRVRRSSPRTGERILGSGVASDGSTAVAVLRSLDGFASRALIEVRRAGVLERSVPFASVYGPAAWFYGLSVELSPTGREAALVFPAALSRPVGDDLAALVDLSSGRSEEELTLPRYRGLAWSPDGLWLALSDGEAIRVYGASRAAPAYVLPLRAQAIAWVSSG